MTVEMLTFADKSPEPHVNGGKSMKFTFQPESRPLDGYTIKRAIHRGGFGEVYYALTDGGKEVALKLLKQHLDVELRGVAQCLNLKHSNLVTIFDVKQDADGDHWVIMEYITGKSLAQVLDAYPNGMPIDDVQMWIAGMVDGLSFLHDRGIVHRDLKPANVFLENGVVKIGDVGLSKFISESHRSAQTQSVGTVYYMAPEVAHGRYGREVDVYSLGIVAYELICGRVPFIGESAGEILMKHLSERPDLSPIPRRLQPVLAQALEKDPLRRTPTARQHLEDFKKAVRGFDVLQEGPQEIPEESFLAATIGDSSTLERERSKQAPPNLKEIIAADVAKAMGLAEKAAQRAREFANDARRASRRSRHRPSYRDRQHARWTRCAGRSRHPYATLWDWKHYAAQKQPIAAPPPKPTAPPPPARVPASDHAERKWIKIAVIAAIVIGSIRASRHGELPLGLVLCGILIYGIYKGVAFLSAGGGGQLSAPLAPPSPAPPQAPREPIATAPPPTAVPAWKQLTPETPRLLSGRQRVSQLSMSLAYAAVCTTLIVGVLSAFMGPGSLFLDKAQLAQFGGTSLVASWLLLAQAKLWEGVQVDPGMRRVMLALTGAIVGLVSWWLNRLLMVDVPTANSMGSIVSTIGEYRLTEMNTRQPSLAGYVVFFTCLMALRKWWRQADSFRSHRLAVWSILPSALLGFVLTAIFEFPTAWGTIWAVILSATIQLSAAWVPPRERGRMMEDARYA
jgi:serine/threonine protein kinase